MQTDLFELAVPHARLGNKKEAEAMLNQLIKKYSGMAYQISLAYTSAGEYETAIVWLETAYKNKVWYLILLNMEPALKPIRNNARSACIFKPIFFIAIFKNHKPGLGL